MSGPRSRLGAAMSEDDLLLAVLEALEYHGWTVTHSRRSDLALVQGTPGFPDILAVRDGQMLAAELKAAGGRLTWRQAGWLAELHAVQHAEARVLRPHDLDPLLEELARHGGRLTPHLGTPRLLTELERAPDGPVRLEP